MRRLSLATALTLVLMPGSALAAGTNGDLSAAAHFGQPAHKANVAPKHHRRAAIAHMAGGHVGGSR